MLGGEPTEPTEQLDPFNNEHLWGTSTQRTEPEFEHEPEPEQRTPATIDTQDSFETAPELSEPVEHFFGALLKQKPKSPTSFNESEMDLNTMNTETEQNLGSMNADTDNSKHGELKLAQPKPFSGKRGELDDFLQDVGLYLAINEKIYNTDTRKIAYALSFMSEGDAKSWKGQFLRNAQNTGGFNLGTWDQFQDDLKDAFKPYDAPGDALEELIALKMEKNTIEDHIARFKILLSRSGVPENSPSAIDYFRKTLQIPLQRKLLELPTQPKDLKGWYEWASRLDNNFRKMQRILGRNPGKPDDKGKMNSNSGRRWNFQQRKDPNAMDVDAMSIEKRTEMMKRGLCFRCEKPGHLSKDCPDKSQSNSFQPRKMNPKELTAHVRSLTALMSNEEKEAFYDEAEKQGF